MKVRIKGNTIRMRLDRSEVRQLQEDRKVEEQTHLGTSIDEYIRYVIEKSSQLQIKASFKSNEIKIQLPDSLVDQWAKSEEISMEGIQEIEPGTYLKILIEKDLKPLIDREEQEDWFPNPKA